MFNADISRKGAFVANIFESVMPKGFAKKMEQRGLKGHSLEELWKFSYDDLTALSNLLGEKKYFLGRDHATCIDCTIFGHLAQFLFIPIDFPQKQFLYEKCPNLVNFVERFKAEHWVDWESKCERKSNVKFLENSNKDKSSSNSKMNILVASIFIGALSFVSVRRYK